MSNSLTIWESPIPRRSYMPSWLPEERAIWDIMQQIEGLGAHHKLTEAVIKLQEAKEALADWWDEQLTFSPTSKETPQWIIDSLNPTNAIPDPKRPIVEP